MNQDTPAADVLAQETPHPRATSPTHRMKIGRGMAHRRAPLVPHASLTEVERISYTFPHTLSSRAKRSGYALADCLICWPMAADR
jgi:hypothetical protein